MLPFLHVGAEHSLRRRARLLPNLGRMRSRRPRSALSLRLSVCPPPSDGFSGAAGTLPFRHEGACIRQCARSRADLLSCRRAVMQVR
jgi:hypothetical protein